MQNTNMHHGGTPDQSYKQDRKKVQTPSLQKYNGAIRFQVRNLSLLLTYQAAQG